MTKEKSSLRICLLAVSIFFAPPAHAGPSSVDKYVTVAPGVRLRLVATGRRASKPAIVFVPGWGADSSIWRGQMVRFGRHQRVISFDPRSQGASTVVPAGNTPEQRAEDLHALLEAAHVDRPVLVGWSQGVQDVAAYVLKYGSGSLSGIVLVDAAVSEGAKGMAMRPEQTAAQFERFSLYVSHQEEYLRGMFGFIIRKPQPPGVVEHAVRVAMKTPPSIGISQLVGDMFGSDLTGSLAKMDCPVLIVAAGTSGELKRQQDEVARLTDAKFEIIPDAGHAVFLDQPDRFEMIVTTFLGRLSARPS